MWKILSLWWTRGCMERTIINAFGLYLPPLSLVHWKKRLNCTLFNRAISHFTCICMHRGRIAMLENSNAAKWRIYWFGAGPAQIIFISTCKDSFLEFHMTALLSRTDDIGVLISGLIITNNHLNVVSACQKIWACNSNDFGLLDKSAMATWGHYSKNRWTKKEITKI